MELLERGQERFDIYCSMCHGRTGEGNGMIVQRGFPPPPSFHIDRLQQAPIGHFFNVITHGYGIMYSYASTGRSAGSLGHCRLHPRLAIQPPCETG